MGLCPSAPRDQEPYPRFPLPRGVAPALRVDSAPIVDPAGRLSPRFRHSKCIGRSLPSRCTCIHNRNRLSCGRRRCPCTTDNDQTHHTSHNRLLPCCVPPVVMKSFKNLAHGRDFENDNDQTSTNLPTLYHGALRASIVRYRTLRSG